MNDICSLCRNANCKKIYYCEHCQFVCFCEEDYSLHNVLNHVMQVQVGGGGRKRKTCDDEAGGSGSGSDPQCSTSRDRVVRPSSPPALPTFERVRTRKSFEDLIW